MQNAKYALQVQLYLLHICVRIYVFDVFTYVFEPNMGHDDEYLRLLAYLQLVCNKNAVSS